MKNDLKCKYMLIFFLTINGCFLGGLYYIYTAHQNSLERNLLNQYTNFSLLYQTGNFTPNSTGIDFYANLGDHTPKVLKFPIVCNEKGCMVDRNLKMQSTKGEFSINPVIVYETFNSISGVRGPYYFQEMPTSLIVKSQIFSIQNSIYPNSSGNLVPFFLPPKYGTFIFGTPIEIYYQIYPHFQEETGSHMTYTIALRS